MGVCCIYVWTYNLQNICYHLYLFLDHVIFEWLWPKNHQNLFHHGLNAPQPNPNPHKLLSHSNNHGQILWNLFCISLYMRSSKYSLTEFSWPFAFQLVQRIMGVCYILVCTHTLWNMYFHLFLGHVLFKWLWTKNHRSLFYIALHTHP